MESVVTLKPDDPESVTDNNFYSGGDSSIALRRVPAGREREADRGREDGEKAPWYTRRCRTRPPPTRSRVTIVDCGPQTAPKDTQDTLDDRQIPAGGPRPTAGTKFKAYPPSISLLGRSP